MLLLPKPWTASATWQRRLMGSCSRNSKMVQIGPWGQIRVLQRSSGVPQGPSRQRDKWHILWETKKLGSGGSKMGQNRGQNGISLTPMEAKPAKLTFNRKSGQNDQIWGPRHGFEALSRSSQPKAGLYEGPSREPPQDPQRGPKCSPKVEGSNRGPERSSESIGPWA